MAFLVFRVTFLASNRNILFQSCFCKAFLALSQNGHALPVAGGAEGRVWNGCRGEGSSRKRSGTGGLFPMGRAAG